MAYEELKAAIRRAIKNNDNQEITGDLLQNTLLSMVDTIGTTAGGGSGSGSGSGVSLGTLLAQLNNENPFPTDNGQVLTYNGSNFIWKTPTGSGSSSRIKNIKLFTNNSDHSFETIELGTADTIGFMQGDNITFQSVVKEFTNVIKISATGSGSGSSGTTSGKLYFHKDSSEESWNGESNFKIIFGSGLNVTWDSHSQITLSATGGSGGSGGPTSTSVSWQDVTNKPSTFTPSSHTHSTSEITGLSSYVQGTKVNNATNADRLLTPRNIWGQSFNGTSDINGNLYMSSAGGGSIKLWMNSGNMLERTNDILHIGNGLKGLSNGEIDLDAYKTVVYTDNRSKHYDFKSNVFDVNSNQIHFGSETNGGKIYWDAANNAFKIEGNVYATGGITALGVSNNATTSNNVDFTFRNVTANTFNVMNSIQLSDSLSLNRNGDDVYLASTNVSNPSYIYLDGTDGNFSLDSQGNAYINKLGCDYLSFSGAEDFEIINADDRGFTISFKYGDRTYHFTPSGGSVTIS